MQKEIFYTSDFGTEIRLELHECDNDDALEFYEGLVEAEDTEKASLYIDGELIRHHEPLPREPEIFSFPLPMGGIIDSIMLKI